MSSIDNIMPLVRQAQKAQERVERLEDTLKAAKAELRRLLDVELPATMAELGVERINLRDGSALEVKQVVDARIPRAKQAEALAWLREHGYGDLIKSQVVASFGAGDDEVARAAQLYLEEIGAPVQAKETVHPQTLKAWARERLEAGDEIPDDLFGLYTGETVRIKKPKEA